MSYNKKIILSGGGTGGSVTPLFQIYHGLKDEYEFLFVGTYYGLEKNMVLNEGIRYRGILSGKWRRYFSFLNFIDIFKIFLAFWQSLFLLIKERPGVIISAGGFVAVPLSVAAWFLHIPVIIHQQDIIPGLANKLMSRVAKIITVTFPSALKYYGKKAKLIGNLGPSLDFVNLSQDNKRSLLEKYNMAHNELPLILVLGGGTGSLFINKLIDSSLTDLLSVARVIHVSGKNDRDVEGGDETGNLKNYVKIDFIPHQDLLMLINLADIVISRCGLATLTELSLLKKVAILIPMPKSHQEYNALEFDKAKGAIVWSEEELSPIKFVSSLKNLFDDKQKQEDMKSNISKVIKNGNQAMINIIKELLIK